ncbi:hypothetical protein OIV83_005757 [Microbotryomycetes sp. JL201]|nr:hypothetical protein OIV83_005757 [Microbotryomycetes sp. JL201]
MSIGEFPRANGGGAHRPPSWISQLLKTGPPALPPKQGDSEAKVEPGVTARVSSKLRATRRQGAAHARQATRTSWDFMTLQKDIKKDRVGHQRSSANLGSPKRALPTPKRPLHPTALPDADFVAFRRKPSLTHAKRISLPPGTLSFTAASSAPRNPPRRLRDGSWDWDGGDRSLSDRSDLVGLTPSRPGHRRTQSADTIQLPSRPLKVSQVHSPHFELPSIWEDESESVDKSLPVRPTLATHRKGSVASYRKPVPALDRVADPFTEATNSNVDSTRLDKNVGPDLSPAKSSISQLDLPEFPPPPSPAMIEVKLPSFEDEDGSDDQETKMLPPTIQRSNISAHDPRRLSVPLSIGRAPSDTDTHSMYSNNDDMEYRIVSSYFEPSIPATPRSTKCFGKDVLTTSRSELAITGLSHGETSPRSTAFGASGPSPIFDSDNGAADKTPRTTVDCFMPVQAVDFTLPFDTGANFGASSEAEDVPSVSRDESTPPARALASFLGNTTRQGYKPIVIAPRFELSVASSTASGTVDGHYRTSLPPSPVPPSSTFTDVTRFSSYTFGNPFDRDDNGDKAESPNTSFLGSTKRSDSTSSSSLTTSSLNSSPHVRTSTESRKGRASVDTVGTKASLGVNDVLNEFSFSSSAKKSLLTYEPFGFCMDHNEGAREDSAQDSTASPVVDLAKQKRQTWLAGRFIEHDDEHDLKRDVESQEPISPRSKGVRHTRLVDQASFREQNDDEDGSVISPELDCRLLDAYIEKEVRRRARERAQRWAEERWELARERIDLDQAFQVGLAI